MSDQATSISTAPAHHQRYARAWYLFRDMAKAGELTATTKQSLQNEMDSAQNHFTFDEFQEFKKTLEGFEDHWAMGMDRMRKELGRIINE